MLVRHPAAEVEIDDGDNVTRIWMGRQGIKDHLELYADSPLSELQGLLDALAAYEKPWQEVREK